MLKFLGSLFHSVRTLAREPVFSLVVVLVLGLGIAANTTIFTVIDRVLLSSLPFRDPARLDVARSTTGFFALLGIQPRLGRTFLPEDGTAGKNHVVLLSHTFFTSHFQDVNPLGHTLILNGIPYTIIGVLPRQFHLSNICQGLFEYKPDLWIPLAPLSASDLPIASKGRGMVVYARLANKVSLAQAETEMKTLAERRAQD